MADKVQMVDLEKIHWDKRFRVDLGDIDDLAESIKIKGVLQPITVYPDLELLAGERRVTAARKAGLKKIPALIRDRKDEDRDIDMREVELIENLFRKDFTWAEQSALISEIDSRCRSKDVDWSARKTAQLLGHSHPMAVSRALSLADAIAVLPELGKLKTQDEALRAVKKLHEGVIIQELRSRQAITTDKGLATMLKIADANYTIGDTFVEMQEFRSEGVVHFIEVDPPYGIALHEQKKQETTGNKVETYQEVPADVYPVFLEKLAKETFRIASKNCWMVFWFGPTHHHLVFTTLQAAGWEVDDIPGIWNKGHGQTNAPEFYLARAYEPFFICRKGQPVLNKRGRSNVFDFAPVAAQKKYHPTERPMPLMMELLETFALPNQVCVVPFAGSGVTLRACYNYGVKVWGCDLNPEYKDKFMLAVEADTKALDTTEGG